jgi:drug/metabolite transporter (DMT)-like permease
LQLENSRPINDLHFIMCCALGIIVYATRYSSAIETTLLLQSEVIFAALFAWGFLKEEISKNKLYGIFFSLFANILILYNGGVEFKWANLALFFAPFFFVLANSIAKNLQKEDLSWSLILSFRMTIGGILLLIFAHLLEGLEAPPTRLLPFLFCFAFFVFGVGKILWQMALHRLDLFKVTALGLGTPAVSLLLAFLWLGETPSNVQWLGILLACIGTIFLLKTRSKQWGELD